MRIVMPTYRRINDQRTLKGLPEELNKRIEVMVRPEEYEEYSVQHGEKVKQVIKLPENVTDYGKTIYHILTTTNGKLCILDDDLKFHIRREDKPTNLRPLKPHEHTDLFNIIETQLDHYSHIYVSPREGNNRLPQPFIKNTRGMRVLCYNLDSFQSVDLEILKDMQTLTDFEINLQLLKLGKPNLLITRYAQGHKSSQASGGCSVQRTLDVQAKCCEILKQRHPEFVSIREKFTKTSWGGNTIRKDVHIQWKKAYEHGRKNR